MCEEYQLDRTERFYLIRRMLAGGRAASTPALLEALGVSRATLKRDLEYLRSRLGVPVAWDGSAAGYRIRPGEPAEELPGLWFSAPEAHALLTIAQLLEQMGTTMPGPQLESLSSRLEALIGSRGPAASEVRQRIKITHAGQRRIQAAHFEALSWALLHRRQVQCRHFNRATGASLDRIVSPARLVYYRDNWYLDGWCHLRGGLRSFSVDALESVVPLESPAREIPEADLEREFAAGYGIFAGRDVNWARLRFTPERARWVAFESWHPDQRADFEPDGSYLLEVPYSDARELVMDILKFGPDVEVLAPESLREQVAALLRRAAGKYAGSAGKDRG